MNTDRPFDNDYKVDKYVSEVAGFGVMNPLMDANMTTSHSERPPLPRRSLPPLPEYSKTLELDEGSSSASAARGFTGSSAFLTPDQREQANDMVQSAVREGWAQTKLATT